MSNTRRLIRQTLTIARRDFIATVFTPTFLIFLLAPLIMMGFATIGGLGAQTMADGAGDRTRIYAIADSDTARRIAAADRELRRVFVKEAAPPPLVTVAPAGDPAAQARRLLGSASTDVPAVLYGPLDRPQVVYGAEVSRASQYLAEVAERTLLAERAGVAGPASRATMTRIARETTSLGGRNQAAFLGVFALFFLTLLLAGQAVGTLAEERSNKVIEVLAAAVPLESVFLGKLIGMFGVAVLFVAFWATIGANVAGVLPPGAADAIADVRPAIGFATFAILFAAYFTTAYLLLGAVFLGIGAQASTPREIQMLSLPITIFQVAMFGFSAAAASRPESWIATAAELFPFSSPFAMIARAANSPALWPHLAAIAWQLLWVAITVSIGAGMFRRGVLQSAGPKFRWLGRAGRY